MNLFASGKLGTAGEQELRFARGRWPRSVRPGPRLPLANLYYGSPVVIHIPLVNLFYGSQAVLTTGERA